MLVEECKGKGAMGDWSRVGWARGEESSACMPHTSPPKHHAARPRLPVRGRRIC